MRLEGVSYQYPGAQQLVLKHVHMEMSATNVNVVLGLNGAGKTTLFDLMAGILPRPAGFVDFPTDQEIVYQLQNIPLLSSLTGGDLVRLIIKTDHRYNGQPITYHSLFEGVEDANQEDKAKKLWERELGHMSPGERRWLAVMAVCQVDRHLYLFDEPTAGVDPNAKVEILERIKGLAQDRNKTVVMSTHILQELSYLDGRINLLHEGEVTFSGTFDEFVAGHEENPDQAFRQLTTSLS